MKEKQKDPDAVQTDQKPGQDHKRKQDRKQAAVPQISPLRAQDTAVSGKARTNTRREIRRRIRNIRMMDMVEADVFKRDTSETEETQTSFSHNICGLEE